MGVFKSEHTEGLIEESKGAWRNNLQAEPKLEQKPAETPMHPTVKNKTETDQHESKPETRIIVPNLSRIRSKNGS